MTDRYSHRGLSDQERAEIDRLMQKFMALPMHDRRRFVAWLLREVARKCLQEEEAIIHRPPAPTVTSVN